MRIDLEVITEWIQNDCSVLDLGCGEGDLLYNLRKLKNATGFGIEIRDDKITQCIHRGVDVIQQDLNDGLSIFSDNSFDYVLMTLAIQVIERPDILLHDILRVGQQAIITFPNFGYWKCRNYLLFKGRMPMSETLPHTWYNTPNIHLCTCHDFEQLCHENGIQILRKKMVDRHHRHSWGLKYFPNLLAEIAIYQITKE